MTALLTGVMGLTLLLGGDSPQLAVGGSVDMARGHGRGVSWEAAPP